MAILIASNFFISFQYLERWNAEVDKDTEREIYCDVISYWRRLQEDTTPTFKYLFVHFLEG